jgi:hypothetical protein
MQFKIATSVLLLTACLAATSAAQQTPAKQQARSQVLVLGTFHMNSPGRDLFNTQTDDVLSPKRQKEMAELIAVLKKFNPTKIAVEEGNSRGALEKRFLSYKAGTHELTRNETEQLGFRLAKELGHATVYGVDTDGEFPYPRLQDYVKAHDRGPEFDLLLKEIGESVKTQNEYLASHTILEALLRMNADSTSARDVGWYYRQAHFGEPYNWAGADLVADWYRRNIRIYSNIRNLIGNNEERVLVIYGAGHLGWLRQMFADDPTTEVRKLSEFVK